MLDMLSKIDKTSSMVGQNRFELLTFTVGGDEVFGINVFKVKEVIFKPTIRKAPHQHPHVFGISVVRDQMLPIIDLSAALGVSDTQPTDLNLVIITEFNRTTQGFLVKSIDRIHNLEWSDIHAPPHNMSSKFLTAITRIDNDIVMIIDVEEILNDIKESTAIDIKTKKKVRNKQVLVVDDSLVARKQLKLSLEKVGFETIMCNNGRDAWDTLMEYKNENKLNEISLIISDIEMPELDGYTLTTKIKQKTETAHIPVILHSSLSGSFNKNIVEQVGANSFIAKFDPNELLEEVMGYLDAV